MGKAQKVKEERRVARTEDAARRQRRNRLVVSTVSVIIVVVAAGFLVPAIIGSAKKTAKAPSSPSPSASTQPTIAPSTNPQEATVNKKIMTIQTDKGTITLELYPDKAPKTVAQISTLVGRGFYNGLTFHRVEPGFVAQGGDPKGDGTGGSDLANIPFEQNDLKHDKGVIAMARSQDKNSANSQFYITLADAHFLDGNYVVFGKVTSGQDVVEKIQKGDKMNQVAIQS